MFVLYIQYLFIEMPLKFLAKSCIYLRFFNISHLYQILIFNGEVFRFAFFTSKIYEFTTLILCFSNSTQVISMKQALLSVPENISNPKYKVFIGIINHFRVMIAMHIPPRAQCFIFVFGKFHSDSECRLHKIQTISHIYLI